MVANGIDSCQYGWMSRTSPRPLPTLARTPRTGAADTGAADTTDAHAADAGNGDACIDGCPAAGLSVHDSKAIASTFKALADPVRLRIWSRIARSIGQTCVCDLQDVGVSQPTVSHHLRKLREAGLIDCERRGTWVYYWTVPGALAPLDTLRATGAEREV